MNRPVEQRKFISPLTYRQWCIHLFFLLLLATLISPASAQQEWPEPFQAGEKWGYKDRQGRAVIAARYLIVMPFSSHGLAAVVDDSGWVYINGQGEKLLRPYVLDNGPDYFREGLARYVSAGKIGYFDESGRIVIPAAFKFAAPFSEGLAAFCEACENISSGEHSTYQGGRWGYLNKKGRIVIGARFEQASPFKDRSATVLLKGEICRINKAGKVLPRSAD